MGLRPPLAFGISKYGNRNLFLPFLEEPPPQPQLQELVGLLNQELFVKGVPAEGSGSRAAGRRGIQKLQGIALSYCVQKPAVRRNPRQGGVVGTKAVEERMGRIRLDDWGIALERTHKTITFGRPSV